MVLMTHVFNFIKENFELIDCIGLEKPYNFMAIYFKDLTKKEFIFSNPEEMEACMNQLNINTF